MYLREAEIISASLLFDDIKHVSRFSFVRHITSRTFIEKNYVRNTDDPTLLSK